MSWGDFIYFAIGAMVCWIGAGALAYRNRKGMIIDMLMLFGIVVLSIFIIGLWIGQGHPPLRTMGETRLWYSLFLATVGFITYKRWKYKWMLSFTSMIACVFVMINLLKPEIHSANLMPALQSYWFVPHVTVYILSYALLGAATIASFIQLNKLSKGEPDQELYSFMDNMVYVGFGLLILGMLMGAVWAKEAWGHYWSWDPKETWAFITGMFYLIFIHMRLRSYAPKTTLGLLPIAFMMLMITWLCVNYLPAAQNSIHVY